MEIVLPNTAEHQAPRISQLAPGHIVAIIQNVRQNAHNHPVTKMELVVEINITIEKHPAYGYVLEKGEGVNSMASGRPPPCIRIAMATSWITTSTCL